MTHIRRPIKAILQQAGLTIAAAALTLGAGALTANAATYRGAPVHIGKGVARTIVRTDRAGKPTSVAVLLSPGVMNGLPTALNKHAPEGSWVYHLPMPSHGPRTGYTEIVIDWNPHGHPPPHVYTVPHFDFHFYGLHPAAVEKISFTGPADPAAKVPNTNLIPQDYQVIPETVVDKMGVHAIDTTAPEFHGKPFTATFIYGYYQGQLVFVEPMVTRAFFLKKPDVSLPVKAPAQYSHPGYYPTRYSVRYDRHKKGYLVELDGLKYWGSR